MHEVQNESSDEWEVKPEILEQLQTWNAQPKTTMLILEAYIESSSEDTTFKHSGKGATGPTQEVEDNDSEEVHPVSTPKKR